MITHGHTTNRAPSPEYRSWMNMRQRCLNPKNNRYHLYGAVGITVCREWESFAIFLKDMGPRPSVDYSIERIDGSKNYEPSNCKWATRQEQARNKSNNNLVEINGAVKCVAEWAEESQINQSIIHDRLRQGEKGPALLRPPERTQVNGEFIVCRRGIHSFPEWRRAVPSGTYCVLCKRERDARKRERKRMTQR